MITNPLYDLVHAGDVLGVERWLTDHPGQLNLPIGDGYVPIHVACLFGHEAVVRLLIERNCLLNLNARNSSGATPLHAAVCFRAEDVAERIARILIRNGAELNAAQTGGQTPLHHAVARNSASLVRFLVDAGADPFLKDDLGRSASDLARELTGTEGDVIRKSLHRAHSLETETVHE